MAQEGTERFVRIQSRCDTTENWEFYNPILAKNEVGYDTTNKSYKIGDGETTWLNLPYSTAGMIKGNGEVFNDYENNYADGKYSHAEGFNTLAEGNMSHAEGNSTFSGKLLSYKVIAQNAETGIYTLDSLENYVDSSDFTEVTSGRWEIIITVSNKVFHTIPVVSINKDTCEIAVAPENFIAFSEVGIDPAITTNLFILRNSNGQLFGNIEIDIATGDNIYSRQTGMHSEGEYSIAFGAGSHAEGEYSLALGVYSHTEGQGATATGRGAHAEGRYTKALSHAAHAEGDKTIAKGLCAHAEGNTTKATGSVAHAEGQYTIASGDRAHAEGESTEATGPRAHAEGILTKATKDHSHAEGKQTQATGIGSHAEGYLTVASGNYSHIEGRYYEIDGVKTISEASGEASHAEGLGTKASLDAAHAEGQQTQAIGRTSHAEGYQTIAKGERSHAEGENTEATNVGAHAEGQRAKASGQYSHAEGQESQATGFAAHAEGHSTASSAFSHSEGTATASGNYGHAEGIGSCASGEASHAEGLNTIAAGKQQHVQGRYNIEDETSAFIIGNGENNSKRSNAMMVDWNGNVKIAGQLQDMNGTSILPFIEKEVSLYGYQAIFEPNYWVSMINDYGQEEIEATMEIEFNSEKERDQCDFRIPPMIIPYSNNANGMSLEYSDDFKYIEFISKGINNLKFEIKLTYIRDLDNAPEREKYLYNDTTYWKILFWRKNRND